MTFKQIMFRIIDTMTLEQLTKLAKKADIPLSKNLKIMKCNIKKHSQRIEIYKVVFKISKDKDVAYYTIEFKTKE